MSGVSIQQGFSAPAAPAGDTFCHPGFRLPSPPSRETQLKQGRHAKGTVSFVGRNRASCVTSFPFLSFRHLIPKLPLSHTFSVTAKQEGQMSKGQFPVNYMFFVAERCWEHRSDWSCQGQGVRNPSSGAGCGWPAEPTLSRVLHPTPHTSKPLQKCIQLQKHLRDPSRKLKSTQKAFLKPWICIYIHSN